MEVDISDATRTGVRQFASSHVCADTRRAGLSVALGNMLVFLGDVCGVAFSVSAAGWICRGMAGGPADPRLLLALHLVALLFAGLYGSRRPYWQETKVIVRTTVQVFLVSAAVAVFLGAQTPFLVSAALTFLLTAFTLPLFHHGSKRVALRLNLWWKPVLVFGGGPASELVRAALAHDWSMGYRPRLAGEECRRIERIAEETGARDLFVADAGMEPHRLLELVNRLKGRKVSVTVVPATALAPFRNVMANSLFEEGRSLVFRRGGLSTASSRFLKRAFDLAAGGALLVCLLPVLAVVALAVRLDSRGPVLFGHRRVGLGGRTFRCWKFRSMAVNAQELLDALLERDPAAREEWEREFKLRDDPRVTRVGRFLRRTSLDELPQIFNVIRGDMSLVGPRPVIAEETERYGGRFETVKTVRPGMTGMWQVCGRSNTSYEERVRLDELFVLDWSLWRDVSILFKTVRVVLNRNGAY